MVWYQSQLVMIGGMISGKPSSLVQVSLQGDVWVPASSQPFAPWPARYNHAVCVVSATPVHNSRRVWRASLSAPLRLAAR
jgi:hypothetical protein